jgi:signal transduction histidine kinase
MLYRAVRELLFNVVRHAKAGQVTVACLRDGDNVSIEVADDGRGFDPAAATTRETRKGGFGLFSIRERLACLGGRFEVKSGRGCGTKALLVAPLQGVRKRKERR